MERANAGGECRVEGSGPHYGMGSVLTPGSQRLYKGDDSSIVWRKPALTA